MAQQKDSKHIFQQKLWLGISNLLKEPSGQDPDHPTNFWYSENLNLRTDPYAPTLNPATVKESGGTVTDFVKWADITPAALTTYLIGDQGNIYSRTATGAWSFLHTAQNSHGNGLQYFYGDDFVYYPNDTNIGRYGPLSSNPRFTDDFLTAQGGVPTNVSSLLLVAASSQYLTAADSSSLSITGDLTLETFMKPTTLPTVGNAMTLIGKWDESTNHRSYKLDLFGVSGYFGSGSDGPLTISSNTTESPIDSACSGTAGMQSLSATNASFAVGQIILIHQTQGTNAGQYERNVISGYTAGTITLQSPLIGTYGTGAQVRTIPQYTNVTINTGFTLTAKAWNGTVGGILSFLYNGTLTINGTISVSGCGFRGGAGSAHNSSASGFQGEGYLGIGTQTNTSKDNGGGGGGFRGGNASDGGSAGGGGGNATPGTGGGSGQNTASIGGLISGSADLTTAIFGGGGGGGCGETSGNGDGGIGGNGGGWLFTMGVSLVMGATGSVNIAGLVGGDANPITNTDGAGSGGGGAAGCWRNQSQTATYGTNQVVATGGVGGTPGTTSAGTGGIGSIGRIALSYLTSFTGTTTPTLNATQDNTLVTTVTIQGRLGISNDGTAFEYLTKNLSNISAGVWNRLSVAWAAASSLATFYLNGIPIGTAVGTKTSINDNASLFYIGADKGASVIGHFYDGALNDVRIWSGLRTLAQISSTNLVQLTGNEAGLQAYYPFNSLYSDLTANANILTQH